MLSKLIKHEFRNTWQLALIFNVVGVVMAFIVMLIVRSYSNIDAYSIMHGRELLFNEWEDLYNLLSAGFIGIYIVFMIVANAIIYLFMAVRFYREIYSDTGYLMHSLPVTKGQLLWSHLICSAVWLFEFVILDVLCVMIALAGVPDFYAEFGKVLNEVKIGLIELAHRYPEITGHINLLAALSILSFLITPFMRMLQTYCAISLGQVFKTHRVFGAFVMYFVISFVVSMISQAFTYIFVSGSFRKLMDTDVVYESMTTTVEMLKAYNIMFAGIVLLLIVYSVVFFVITRYRMLYKLDLE